MSENWQYFTFEDDLEENEDRKWPEFAKPVKKGLKWYVEYKNNKTTGPFNSEHDAWKDFSDKHLVTELEESISPWVVAERIRVLENASCGASAAGSVASVVQPLGAVIKRNPRKKRKKK